MVKANVMAEKYLWPGSKSLSSGGKIGSMKKKRKNPLKKIKVKIIEKEVTPFSEGNVVSFQSSVSEQEIVARITLAPRIVPPIAIKYVSKSK